MNNTKLIFVYNADSGILNAAKDFVHRIVSPQTYQCNLCAVTYSNTGMKSEWRQFVNKLAYPVEILRKDEFTKSYSLKNPKFPSAFQMKEGELSYFITVEEMNDVNSVDELIAVVRDKLGLPNE